ncbi:MAG: BppU family phage baseplate upper protein, partial [Anaerotignum propionicum]|uniref:BppU family phage baseplate upper protein n=1 Tax=Anaerotignum propionicum TaxID=28446 RepID=UPI002B207D3C
MAQVYKKLEVDVNKEVTSIITAVQNDTKSRYLDVILLDGSTAISLTGHEVRIYGKKADGTEFYNNGAITNATAGRCQFELTSQALVLAQDLEVQIILFKNNVEVLSTQPFKIHIVKSLISAGAVESSNEYGALVVLYQNLYEAHDLMTTMVQNIGVPGEIANQLTIDTMWDAWEYLCNYVSEDLTTLLQNAINNNSVDGVVQRLGNTADTGGTATAGTVMGKLNALTDFNWNYQMVQRVKSSAVTTIPAPVASDTQGTVSFGIEFDTPVPLDYIKINILSVPSGYGDRSGITGNIRLTYYDNTTQVISLVYSNWNYTYYLYLGAVFGFAFHMYGSSALSGALTTASVPNFKTAYIKKVEALNWYHRNAITDPPITGTCNVRVDVYYNEMTKVRG